MGNRGRKNGENHVGRGRGRDIMARSRRHRRVLDRVKLFGKGLVVLAGCFCLLYLAGYTVRQAAEPIKERTDTYIPLQEAGNLAWLLADSAERSSKDGAEDGNRKNVAEKETGIPDADALLETLYRMDFSDGNGYLTWEQAEQIFSRLPESREMFGGGAYHKKERVTASDWYEWFDRARKYYDPENRIQDVELEVLASGERAIDSDGKALSVQELAASDGSRWHFFADRFGAQELSCRRISAVARDGGLYALREAENGPVTFENIWVMEAKDEIRCFWNGFEILLPGGAEEISEDFRKSCDRICDLTFKMGVLTKAVSKDEKISGRLLSVTEAGAEVEGHGVYPLSDKIKAYRLYDTPKQLSVSELKIGYAFTDFVVEDGVIEAALVPRRERMEAIRVLVKTTDFGGAWHEKVVLTPDCECTVRSGTGEDEKRQRISAGETMKIAEDSPLFAENSRIVVEPEVLTGRVRLENVGRSQGTPSYRGKLELVKGEEGILVINEVLLEEYLYAVVPSEMPSSYPLEALKSQAICARTYAYDKMCHAGLARYGAHVDDSAAFQVYNNIEENADTTRAVKETAGQVLYYGDGLAQTYYYSTSCGYGTDASVWESGNAQHPYLMAQAVNTGNMSLTLASGQQDIAAVMAPVMDQAALLSQNEIFDGFIRTADVNFYEAKEPWYRWSYRVEQLETERLAEALKKRQAADQDGVLTMQEDGSWEEQTPPEPGKIREISVIERGPGGVASKLLIEGENASLLVRTEHNIRYALCDGKTEVIRQDGSSAGAGMMIPSAFFSIETSKKDGFVVGYTLNGGGFGHGVGLSQNGARNMALQSIDAEGILGFFYKGCRLRSIYETEQS